MTRKQSIRWFWYLTFWLVAVPILVIAAIDFDVFFSDQAYDWIAKRSFDSDLWKSAELAEKPLETRIHMVDDLLANYRLIGMTRDEIEELLGPPGEDPSFRQSQYYAYWLGPKRGFMAMEDQFLSIGFDERDIVFDVAVLTY